MQTRKMKKTADRMLKGDIEKFEENLTKHNSSSEKDCYEKRCGFNFDNECQKENGVCDEVVGSLNKTANMMQNKPKTVKQ